ncbi:MAG: ATP-binding protein [Bacteroidota bacterium]|jgi:PAS domain S-box-containing protein|nr:PAS domain S-box protein [Ignavibacteria bacterium]MCU7513406.1 PAS domain S-box protein [Ignavibacteria bacterium]MCU7522177.1 PAS domain S-box protein [Ignavibacteria bacterium]MCU7525108.1 PAS domain S-box protein [Ignavibacteria bacterium]
MSGDLESGQLDSNLSGELAEITPGLENETEDSSGESGKIGKVHLKWDDENYVPEKLLEELERYRELFESAPSGYIVMTPDFVITSVNRSSQMLLGLPESLLVKRPLTQFIVKGYQNIFYSYRLRIFKKPGRYSCELKFQKKNGPDFHGLLECHPVFDDNGCIEIRAALLDISEHKRQEINRRAGLVQTSIESMMDAHAILRAKRDKAGKITDFIYEYINEAGCRNLNISREKIIGSRFLGLFPQMRDNGIFDDYCRTVYTGEPLTKESLIYDEEQALRPIKMAFDIQISRLNDGVVVTWRDITERIQMGKRLQQELKRSKMLSLFTQELTEISFDYLAVLEKTARRVAELIGDSCVIRLLSDDKRMNLISYYNPEIKIRNILRDLFSNFDLCPVAELAPEVMQGNPVLVSKADYPGMLERMSNELRSHLEKLPIYSILSVPLFLNKKLAGVITIFRHKKTNPPYTPNDQFFLQQIAGKTSLAISNAKLYGEKMREIEERKIAEKALAEKQALLMDVLEFVPVGVWVLDKKGKRLICNQMAREIWGGMNYSGRGDLQIHKGWWPNTGERILDEEWATARTLLKGETVINEEVLIECFDSSIKTILLSSVPIQENGELGAIITNVDISEIRHYQEKLQHTLLELERSNKELEQFAYIASHDLQEPMRMVASFTQLLAARYQGKLDEKADEYIAFALEGARRMQTLIRDLLKYARVTSRLKPFELLDCNEILYDVLSDLQLVIGESSAEITSDTLPVIMGDITQIRQLLQNLISNAIKFRGANKPEIHISAVRGQKDWTFSIRDNGIGIDPQFHERIFLLFQRLHEREKYPGTGIGLALCKKIIELHGGRIWLESEPGRGTTFYFSIPRIRQEIKK